MRVHHPDDSRFYTEGSGEIVNDGDVVALVVTMPGMGSVTGRVTNEDASPAADVRVTVRSTHPTFGGFFNTQTDGNGFYRQDRLALGNVSATVFDTSRQLFGEPFGVLDTGGTDVDPDDPRLRPAERVPGGLPGPAPRDENVEILTVGAARPEEMKLGPPASRVAPLVPRAIEVVDRRRIGVAAVELGDGIGRRHQANIPSERTKAAVSTDTVASISPP